jgi:uncharacterized protein (DUF433 family)
MTPHTIPLGTGIYLRSDAARLLRVSAPRLRRWVDGYTYWYDRHGSPTTRRSRPPIVSRDLPVIDRAIALSFVELMELRVVKALVDHGMSLQAVRAVAMVAADYFQTQHPLASRRLYTDGKKAFAALHGDNRDIPDLVELSPHQVEQVIAGEVFQPFLAEVDFNPTSALAERWWPLGKDVPIVLDPAIAFGAPSVAGTAIRTSTLARMIAETDPVETAAAFQLEPAQATAAWDFEQQLHAA